MSERWLTDGLPELVGTAAVAEMLGVWVTTINEWLEPGSGEFGPDKTHLIPPAPVGQLKREGRVWAKADIERWQRDVGPKSRGRQRGAKARETARRAESTIA